jgi:response regulator NasT
MACYRALTTDRALRIVAADEDRAALEVTAALLRGLGHEVTSYAVAVREAAERIAADDPDLAIVVLHDDPGHALDLIEEIAEYASGPVVALTDGEQPEFVAEAAQRGVSANARSESPEAVQSAIAVAMERWAQTRRLEEQVGRLEGALGRRAVIERAKGILMERHGINERAAFERLREHARSNNRTVVAVSQAVLDGHALLPREP